MNISYDSREGIIKNNIVYYTILSLILPNNIKYYIICVTFYVYCVTYFNYMCYVTLILIDLF